MVNFDISPNPCHLQHSSAVLSCKVGVGGGRFPPQTWDTLSSSCFMISHLYRESGPHLLIISCSKGRRQNIVKTGDFLQKNVKCILLEFVDQLHPHHMLGSKVTWVTTASCCYTILGNVFLLNGGSSHQPSAKA